MSEEGKIDSMMQENRVFNPSHEFSENAVARQFNALFQSPHLAEKYKLKLENQLGIIKKHIALYFNRPDEINFAIIKEDIVNY